MLALFSDPSVNDVVNNPDLISDYIDSRQRILQSNDLLLAALFVCTVFIAIICLIAIYIAVNQFFARRYVHRRLHDTYFCGFRLDAVIRQRLWPNLERYLDLGMSEVAAITTMTALRGNRTAQLVSRPETARRRDWYSWVIFRYGGIKYIIDPLQLEQTEVARCRRIKKRQSTKFRFLSSDSFWATPVCRQIGQKLQTSRTSYLFYEILSICGNPGHYDNFSVYPESAGYQLIPLWLESTRVVAQNILNDFMAQSDYHEPSSTAVLTAMRTEINYQFPKSIASTPVTDYFSPYLSTRP